MEVNQGKIFTVDFTDPKEDNKTTYVNNIYAVCEDHAKRIFERIEPDAIVVKVNEVEDCYSEDYEESIPEINLAKNIMFAIFEEMRKDEKVTTDYALATLDIAYTMTKMALQKTLSRQAKESSEEKEKKE